MATTKKSITDKVTEQAGETFKFPVTFKEFSKNPVVGTMFLVIIGISGLYVDIRTTFNKQIDGQGSKIEKMEVKVDMLTDAVRRADSALSSTTTKISTLEQLGAIQKLK
jgi:hypothetical protein